MASNGLRVVHASSGKRNAERGGIPWGDEAGDKGDEGGVGVTRVSLMGWKLCGDKKERGLVLPRDRLRGA